MTVLYCLYAKIYLFLESINSIFKNSIIEWSTLYILSILLMMNIVLIIPLKDFESLTSHFGVEVSAIGLMLLLIGVNYLIFIYKNKYVKIVDDYRNSSYSSVSGFLVILYVIFTISFFYMDHPN